MASGKRKGAGAPHKPQDRARMRGPLKKTMKRAPKKRNKSARGEVAGAWFEKLGDLLLQVVFHAQMADEEGRFTIVDVIREIYEKMIRRHPHVFGEKQAK